MLAMTSVLPTSMKYFVSVECSAIADRLFSSLVPLMCFTQCITESRSPRLVLFLLLM
jgi:hypothetical protein